MTRTQARVITCRVDLEPDRYLTLNFCNIVEDDERPGHFGITWDTDEQTWTDWDLDAANESCHDLR